MYRAKVIAQIKTQFYFNKIKLTQIKINNNHFQHFMYNLKLLETLHKHFKICKILDPHQFHLLEVKNL